MLQAPVTQGEQLHLTVSGLAFGGQGIARLGEFVVFVDGGLPGDTALVEVRRVRKRYAEARVLSIVSPSPERTAPLCPHFGECGGCRWQVLRYEAQTRYKEQHLRESLERLGGFLNFEMRPIRQMDNPWRYRNKVEFSAGRDQAGLPSVGFHPPGRWDSIVPVSNCLLIPREMDAARAAVEDWLRDSGAPPWDPRRRSGLVQSIIVRRSHALGEVLVGVAAAGPALPDESGLVQRLIQRVPGLAGVVRVEVIAQQLQTTATRLRTLWGVNRIRERLGGLELDVSLEAFLQTNTAMAEVLYRVAAEAAGTSPHTVVWDLYSGIGSIALYMARATGAVLGVEVNEAAVRDARRNATRNGMDGALFLHGDVRKTLKAILEAKLELPDALRHPSAVVLDPPRGGLAKKVVARVAQVRPERVVYVSCNPATMAHDLTLFAEAGYQFRHVTPVDMFPHTPHIECVALLSREGDRES